MLENTKTEANYRVRGKQEHTIPSLDQLSISSRPIINHT